MLQTLNTGAFFLAALFELCSQFEEENKALRRQIMAL